MDRVTDPVLRRRPVRPPGAPLLDAQQARVVQHAGGPLLVLAGPGTGKTTTLVEAVVDRVERRGLAPEQVLVLTFSRKAAQELRERVTARLGRTTRGALAMTFHSYAYALLRRELAAGGGPPLRLLSGPEQDLEVARLLEGVLDDGAGDWPEALRPALPLRGFRRELRDLLQRAQERGVDGRELAGLGAAAGRPEWTAAGRFLEDYEGRFALDPSAEVLDHSGLVRAAAGLLEADPELRERERAARAVVVVDEYQDTDPAQVRLLQALAGEGRDLVAVGDPDQSIYAFRGADVRGILDFPTDFPTVDGRPAPVVELRTCRRSGPVLLAASRSVARRLPAGRLSASFRDLQPDPVVVRSEGSVEVLLAASPTGEAALVADVLRRAHLVDGLAWSEMAVLLRSTPRSLAVLRRGLHAAGVPVGVPADEVPLVEEPLVRALLDVLSAALRPDAVPADGVLALLGGPLVRADGLALRRLRRALREADLGAGGASASDELLVDAFADPRSLLPVPDAARRPMDRLHRLVRAVRTTVAADAGAGTAEQVLWALWEATGLARRLEQDSLAGGSRGALADRSLDAVLALFDAAARYVDRLPHGSVLGFVDDVEAQEVPGDTLAQRTPEGDAVRVMTAHASKGLEWPLVVVAGVQEGVWPDLRLRGSLLGADELAAAADPAGAGLTPTTGADRRAELLAEERRLFYVAATRARDRLVVTAVAGSEGDDRPSRFVEELGVAVPDRVRAAGRPLTGGGLVAELRHVAATADDPALREAACRRLALAAGLDAEHVPHVASAHPDRWWGLAPLSEAAPLVADDEGVRVSPSKVESFDTCSLRWFLESAVGVGGSSGPAQVVGSLVHALAELGSGADALDEAALTARLDEVLPELDLGAPWMVRRRREEAVAQLRRFLDWQRSSDRALVGTELAVEVLVGERAVLAGRVDRLERDADGRAVVVDLKTGSTKPSKADLARHPQLGVYQLAVALGAFAEQHGLTEPGGAALLQLKTGKKADEQLQPALAADDDPDWAAALVERVVQGMSGSDFPATVNEHCARTCAVRSSCPAWPDGESVLR
jgi:superfamily I DNA/RNA helicase/RecB family exonuclease